MSNTILFGQQKTFHFRNVGVADGLSLSKVYCLFQDSFGFTWIGTEFGLNRYNGYEIETFKADGNPRTGLIHNSISCLYEDRRHQLWIGTYGAGLSIFNLKEERVTNIPFDPTNPKGPASGRFKDFLEDDQGRLWVATYNGLDRYDADTKTFTHYQHDPNNPQSLSNRVVRDLHIDQAGRFWVGTTGGGLNRFYPDSGTFEHYRYNPNDPTSLNSDSIKCIYEDEKGRLWIGTTKGLSQFHPESGTFTRYPKDPIQLQTIRGNRIYDITGDKSGFLWIGTLGDGLYRFDPESGRFTHISHDPSNPMGLSENRIRAVLVDPKGILWVGTYAGVDIHPLAADHFTHFRHNPANPLGLSGNRIRSLLKTRNGDIWAGTYKDGLNRMKRLPDGTAQFTHYRTNPKGPGGLSSNNVYALLEDAQGAIWMGTDDGINHLNPQTQKVTHHLHDPNRADSLSEDRVRGLYIDHRGTLWVGTYSSGLNEMIEPGRFKRYQRANNNPSGIVSNRVRAINQDTSNRLLIGTFRGFCRMEDDGRFIQLAHDPDNPNSIVHDQVHCISRDQQGHMWIGTFGGLSKMEGDQFTNYRLEEGLPSNFILGVLVDQNQTIWVSTGLGLANLDPTSGFIRTYDTFDGLQSNEFSMGAYASGRDGELLFGGVNGFNAFFPDSLRRDLHPPDIHLTHMLLQNQLVGLKVGSNPPGFSLEKPLRSTSDLTLTHREYLVTFEFAGIHLADPSKNRYAYLMEGLDTDWIQTDAANRRATYHRLPPGRYQFRVKSANPEGVWNPREATLALHVIPPPWRTWWAFSLYGLVVVGILLAYLRAQKQKLNREKETNRRLDQMVKERTASLQKRHDEIESLERIVKIINGEIGLSPVLQAILSQGLAMFDRAESGVFIMREPDSDQFKVQAYSGFNNNALEGLRVSGDALRRDYQNAVSVAEQDVLLIQPDPVSPSENMQKLGCPRIILSMPLSLEEHVVGFLMLSNYEDPHAFDNADAQRLNRYREHVVSALAKARLLQELQAKNEEILRAQDKIILQEKMSSMGLLTAGIAHEIKNPLNFITNFAVISADLIRELEEEMHKEAPDADPELVSELMNDLSTNVKKIASHGQRANDVVKSMMNLAGGVAGTTTPTEFNDFILESAQLAREGSAGDDGFHIHFSTKMDPTLGKVSVQEGDLRRVLINLITNAGDALRTKAAAVPGFQPAIDITTKNLEQSVEIVIRDNGPGISQAHQSRIFTPFFTTKTCDSGNVGLGLSLCYDIIVREHHGELFVESEVGEYTRFVIRLPKE